jgi:prepilin-type N-terminal cleavage/methylation domain-containing protein
MDYMTKNRNKGFSLVEVIIGVAVLTILLTPVVKQLAQTLQTSRLAKEQQYVNENATSLMEYVQKTSFDSLSSVSSSTSTDLYVTSGATTTTEFCEIYVYDTTGSTTTFKPIDSYLKTGDGTFKSDTTEGSTASAKGINYTAKVYNFNDATLGSRKTKYTRTVMLDDLSNKISALEFEKDDGTKSGLSITYGVLSLDDITLPTSSGDFELTSEGSIVIYDTRTVGDAEVSYISAIVCTLKDSSTVVSDPNETTIGSMHDLVNTQMALVNGALSDYDATARDSLHTEMLDVIKTNAPDTYDQIQNNETMNLDSYISGFTKSIFITIDQNEVNPSAPYYQISVNVAYDASFKIAGKTYKLDTMEYNVFSQKYNYEGDAPTVPSVYIEYQPFLVDDIGYATSEYIYIENYVDNATIYMYKPTKDYVYTSGNYYGASTESTYESEEEELDALYSSDSKVYNQTGYSDVAVDIYINAVKGTNSDTGENTEGKTTNLYTNLDVTKTGTATSQQYGQFILDGSLTDTTSYENFTVTQETTKSSTTTSGSGTSPVLRLLSIKNDTSNSDRLYTATVMVSPKTSTGTNAVTLTGAKGGN